jgi:hypothetical protein
MSNLGRFERAQREDRDEVCDFRWYWRRGPG